MAVPIIWFPFTGSLKNNGLDAARALTCSSALFTNGKLGKCLNIENYASTTTIYSSLQGLRTFSFACWLRIIPGKAFANYAKYLQIGFTADDSTNVIRIENTTVDGAFQIIFNKSTTHGANSNGYYGVGSSTTEANNKWCHIAVTNDGINIRTYLNGVLKWTNATSNIYDVGNLTGSLRVGESGVYGHLNDLRIYDECLSAKQINILSQGLLLHYPLDVSFGVGNIIYDTSGYGYNATMSSSPPTYNSDTKVGNGSLSFNGSNYVTSSATIWDVGTRISEFSICQWMKVDEGWVTGAGMHGLSWTNNFIRISLGKSNMIWCYCKYIDSAGSVGNISVTYGSTSNIVESQWYHIAVVFKQGIFYLYLNGERVASTDHSSTFTNLYYGQTSFYLGSYSTSSELGVGGLSDIRYYATALSDAAIKELYQAKISVDNDGNLYCHGVIQGDGLSMFDTGVIQCKVLKEIDDGSNSGGHSIEF